MTTTNCHTTNEDTRMEDHTDPEIVPALLPRDIAAEWFARVNELNALANEHGLHVTICVGAHPDVRPTVGFITSNAFPCLLPDLSADREREWGPPANERSTYRTYDIDGCTVSTHDQRASARVTS